MTPPTPTVDFSAFFTSVEDVWLVWLATLGVFALLAHRSLRALSWGSVGAFARDERGASYALGYVMTFPAYLLLVCLIVQATLILLVKMGTVYAAYAAARTAIVWQPSQGERSAMTDDRAEFTEQRAQRAAAMAMTPFASGFAEHLTQLHGVNPRAYTSLLDAELYARMYESSAEDAAGRSSGHIYLLDQFEFGSEAIASGTYVRNKARFAAAATEVRVGGDSPDGIVRWNEDVPVTVTYTTPIHIPGMGRVFGERRGGFFSGIFVREISTTATLPSEAAETESGRLGIPYDPRELVAL